MEMKEKGHLCPVCGKHRFTEYDSFEICPVCGWWDEQMQEDNPDWTDCSNIMSLNEAREAWKNGKQVI